MDPNNLVAGMAAGVFTAMVLHPIDLVKVRLQVQDGRTRAVQYRGIKHAVTTIGQQEGARGFYRGVVPACWGSGGSWGFYFLFYEACKRRLLEKQSAEAGSGSTPRLSATQHVYAAWEGGTLTCLLTNPMWLIKTRMQLQGQGPNASGAVVASSASAAAAPGTTAAASAVRPYSGVINAVQSIVKEEGFFGLYRGLLPALLLVSHGMIQFGVYEEAKQLMPAAAALLSGRSEGSEMHSTGRRSGTDVAIEPAKVSPGFASAYLFAAAGASKALATTATYPYQVRACFIKSAGVLLHLTKVYRAGCGAGVTEQLRCD
jgi:hypothetical protein